MNDLNIWLTNVPLYSLVIIVNAWLLETECHVFTWWNKINLDERRILQLLNADETSLNFTPAFYFWRSVYHNYVISFITPKWWHFSVPIYVDWKKNIKIRLPKWTKFTASLEQATKEPTVRTDNSWFPHLIEGWHACRDEPPQRKSTIGRPY